MTIMQSVILGIAFGLSVTNFLFNLGNTRRHVSLERKVDMLMQNRLRDLLLGFLKDSHKANPDSTKTSPDKP